MNLKQTIPACFKSLCVASLAISFAGCASSGVKNPSGVPVTQMNADESGFVGGTGVESQGIVTVTDKIARQLLTTPEIAHAQTAPSVVLLPVENNTRFTMNKDLFLTRIRAQLNEKAQGKVRFLARDRLAALEQERTLKQSGQLTSSSDPKLQEFKGADYFLTGKLEGQSTHTSKGLSDYILYTFQLINPRTSEIVFEGSHEIKKQGLEDASYR